MVYPDNRAADEHFENLRAQYAEGVNRVRALCDEATDSRSFVEQSSAAVREVFNSAVISHLSLRFSVAICCNN